MIAFPPGNGHRAAAQRIKAAGVAAFIGAFLILTLGDTTAQTLGSVTLAWNRSPGSTIAGYRLYQGVASRTYTNSVTVGNVTNCTVSTLRTGVSYYFAVAAYDTAGLESQLSTEVSYNVPVSNTSPPTIVLAAPANGASYTAPANINLAANVTANGHTITKVQFYNGTALLGEVPAAPYNLAWNNVSAGSYSLSARAVYDGGSTVSSSPGNVGVTLLAPAILSNNNFANATVLSGSAVTVSGSNVGATIEAGEPPKAGNAGGASVWWSWTAPASGSVTISTAGSTFDTILGIFTGASVSGLTAIAANDDSPTGGTLTSKVTFNAVAGTKYAIGVDGFNGAKGNIVLSVALTIGATSSVSGVGTAGYSLVRVPVTSARSSTLTSAGQTGTVSEASGPDMTAPLVSLTAPMDGSTVSETITLSASASDDTVVTRVEFYCDTTVLVGTATAVPYTALWNSTAMMNGAHSFVAKAYDAAGNSATSSSSTVTISNATSSAF
jgi:hypothetical protein